MGWTPVFEATALPVGAVKVARNGSDQAAVFRVEDGTVHAVDNRCPHEGYPLAQGLRVGCTLTCAYHNFKFDLATGDCLKGDEAVRRIPVREVDGQVELDWTPPDRSAEVPKRWASWSEALRERRVSQAARDTARLLHAGVDPSVVLARLAAWDARHAEYGVSHAPAVCADLLQWLPDHPGVSATVPIAQALDLASLAGVRRDPHPLPTALPPDRAAFLAAVESEALDAALGHIAGAVDAGIDPVPWLVEATSAHFLDFGHALIYTTKFQALAAADPTSARALWTGLVRGVVNGTREDTLPGWRRYIAALREVDLDALAAVPPDPSWTGDLRTALGEASNLVGLRAVVDALAAGAPVRRVADQITLAGADRLHAFDPSIDLDRSVQDNWLSATHVFTHAVAVREVVEAHPGPAALRHLLFAARMVTHHRVLDGPLDPVESRPGDLAAALLDRAPTAPGIAVHGWTHDRSATRRALMDHAIADPFTRAISVAHAINVLIAALDTADRTGDPTPIAATVRWWVSPGRERRVQRWAHEAIALVVHGKTPRLLAP